MCGGQCILLDIFHEPLAVFGAVLLRSLLDQHVHFLRADFNPVGLANLRQQQPQPHPAHGDGAVIVLLGLNLGQGGGRIFFLLRFLVELRPNLLELGLNHGRRHVKAMPGGEQIEQRALHLGAGLPGSFLLKLAAQ